MKRVIKLACLVLVGFAAIGMWAQDDAGDENAANAAKPAKAAVSEVQATSPGVPVDYIIGADDTLHISVWKEPDMSVALPVRPDGKISMPLLDDVQAAGMTPMQLGISIRDKLKKYIADPRVTVVVTAMNSQRIYVLGEVLHSGPMSLLPGMTMLAGVIDGRIHAVCQSQSDLPVTDARRQADKNPVQLQRGDQGPGRSAKSHAQAGRHARCSVRLFR